MILLPLNLTAISASTKVNILFYGIRSQSQLPDHFHKGAEYAVATISMEGLDLARFPPLIHPQLQ